MDPNLEMIWRQGVEVQSFQPDRRYGTLPAILLINPKYPHNVGATIRAASCYGIHQVWITGNRVSLYGERKKYRLPREERMKGFSDVELRQFDRPFDQFQTCTPIAVELRDNSEDLKYFKHPDDALYVFGPEDGSLGRDILHLCHRFVRIPSRHCLNLAAAVYTVLYDREAKSWSDHD